MKSTMITCDLCDEVIDEGPIDGYHGRMVQVHDDYQVWPTEKGDADICPRCCIALARAKAAGMIDYDLEPALRGGGFEKLSDGEWQRGGMFQERFHLLPKVRVVKGETND